MDKTAQNIAIAKFCGYKVIRNDIKPDYPWCFIHPSGRQIGSSWSTENNAWENVPCYTESLDLMHEVEKILDSFQWQEYGSLLSGPMSFRSQLYKNSIHADAGRKARVFLQVLDLWVYDHESISPKVS